MNLITDRGLLRWLTAEVISERFGLEAERWKMESRLSEKLKLAGGVVSRVGAKIEARADALIAREAAEFDPLIEKSFAGHETMLDDSGKALDTFADELRQLSNGPLPASPVPAPGSQGSQWPGEHHGASTVTAKA